MHLHQSTCLETNYELKSEVTPMGAVRAVRVRVKHANPVVCSAGPAIQPKRRFKLWPRNPPISIAVNSITNLPEVLCIFALLFHILHRPVCLVGHVKRLLDEDASQDVEDCDGEKCDVKEESLVCSQWGRKLDHGKQMAVWTVFVSHWSCSATPNTIHANAPSFRLCKPPQGLQIMVDAHPIDPTRR